MTALPLGAGVRMHYVCGGANDALRAGDAVTALSGRSDTSCPSETSRAVRR